MSDCIEYLKETLNLSYSLIGEIILAEKTLIDKKYTENDFFDKYIHIATLLDDKLEKLIYHYSTNLDFFIDLFKKPETLFSSINQKDYKAIFITDNFLNNDNIKKISETEVKVYCITKDIELNKNINKNIKLIDINLRSEYIKELKKIKIDISKKYKKQFYLEIIKQNHEIEFSNYLALKKKVKNIKGE